MMMRKFTSLLILLLAFTVNFFGQTDATSAVSVTAIAYTGSAPATANHCLLSASGQVTTACSNPAPTDVKWFKFVGPANGSVVKISVTPVGFDAVIDFFTGPPALPVYKQCVNAAGSGAAEILKTSFTTNPIVPGTTYYFRVSATTDVNALCFNLSLEYYPTTFLICSPNPCPADPPPAGFSVVDNIKRNAPSATLANLIQNTRFHIYNALDTLTEVCMGQSAGTLSQKALNTFTAGCICYGNNYVVYCEIMLDGVWGGYGPSRLVNMEAAPTVTITNTPCQTLSMSGALTTGYLGSGQSLEFEFTTSGQTPISAIVNNSSQIILQNVPCLQYNRIYSVRVRVRWCNVWGPWSSPYCLVTAPMPYLQLNGSCPQTIGQFGFLTCNFVVGVNQYTWQFAEVNPSNPIVPIAPAILRTTLNNTINLNTVALVIGKSYRVAIKPKMTNCGLNQEWDYGQFCMVTVSSTGMVLLEEDNSLENPDEKSLEYSYNEKGTIGVFSYSGNRSNRTLTINLSETGAAGKGFLRIFNSAGQQVYIDRVFTTEETPIAQTLLPSDLPDGIYIVSVNTEKGAYTDKFFLSGQ